MQNQALWTFDKYRHTCHTGTTATNAQSPGVKLIETKAKIINALLKQEGVFKAARITQLTGLSRQLVYYHLNEWTKLGALDKTGVKYRVINRDKMIRALEVEERTAKGGPLERDFHFTVKTNKLIDAAIAIVSAGGVDVRPALNRQIDEAMQALTELRHYLNSQKFTPKRAAKLLLEWESDPTKVANKLGIKDPAFDDWYRNLEEQ